MALTAEDDWRKGAAGDPQVMGIFLCIQLLRVQIPESKVSIGGASHEHLTARAKGAGYYCGVTCCCGPSQTQYGQDILIYKNICYRHCIPL